MTRRRCDMPDRISLLPDAILCRILSFVPTKDAVSTSVLSKRWKPLWRSVPILNFEVQRSYIDNHKTYVCFARFVYATILTRDAPVQRFSFKLRFSSSSKRESLNRDLLRSDLKIWLNTVVQRGIERLHVRLSFQWNLPPSIFTCRTLVVLKLRNCIVNEFSSIDLPSLKILYLDDVHFAKYRFLVELLNGCPILEDLKTIDIYSGPVGSIALGEFKRLPKLVDAYVWGIFPSNIPLEAFCNAEYLYLEMGLLAPNIPVFPNVTHLELSCCYRILLNLLFEMLNHCPNLQIFALHKVNAGFTGELCPIPHVVPDCISSKLNNCSLGDFVGNQSAMIFAKYVLQNSSALRTMNIKCKPYFNPLDKLETLKKELSICPRSSTACQLLFECKEISGRWVTFEL